MKHHIAALACALAAAACGLTAGSTGPASAAALAAPMIDGTDRFAVLGSTATIAGSADPGAAVDVFFHRRTDVGYTDRRDLVANSQGRWSTTFVVNDDYRYYAVAGGQQSQNVLTQASPVITSPNSGRVARNSTIILKGPGVPGSAVTLRFHKSRDAANSYPLARTVRVAANGTWTRAILADQDYRLYANRGANDPNRSARLFQIGQPAPAPQPIRPANPGDTRNCGDFTTQRESQAYFDRYYPYYGDVARLDQDNDRIACENSF